MSHELIAEATDVQRRFPFWKRQAQRNPVIVKNHGEPEVVMMSPEEYHRLMRRHRRVITAEEMSDEMLEAISKAEPPLESAQFDHELDGWEP
ncbi:MAG: type II toxin-antitoxin system Phd/YefM family antitoxin [Bdellovibrionales bacterium]